MAKTLFGKFRQALFPDFPRGAKFVKPDGHLTNIWELGLSNVFQNLQQIFSNEGYSLPILSETDLDTIKEIYTALIGKNLGFTNPPTPDISGRIVYDIDNEVPRIFIIEFEVKGDPTSQILGPLTTPAGIAPTWKTFTIT